MLSSTFKELQQHRAAVIDAINRLRLFAEVMELDSALPEGLIDASLNKVQIADAYVGIIGFRYGQTPDDPIRNPDELSITELEYSEAEKLGLPICMFVMSDNHPIPRSAFSEETGEQQQKLETFRKRVAKKHIHAEFHSVEDLKTKAMQSLVVLRERLDACAVEQSKVALGGAAARSGNWLYKTIAVIGSLAVAVIAGVFFKDSFFKPKPVQENTEIVLDRSKAMLEKFDGKTKLVAAVEAAQDVLSLVASSDNLALRQFGGACANENTTLAVKFSQNNVKRLQKWLGKLAVDGQASLAHAVIEATGDFNDTTRFPKDVSKRLVVIIGSDDTCLRKDPIPAIRERIERAKRSGSNIEMDFRFIGLGLTPQQQANVTKIAEATRGTATFVESQKDLRNELRRDLIVERVVQNTNALVDSLNAGMNHLNDVLVAMGRPDYPAAETALKRAQEELIHSESSFRALGQGESKEQFKRLYETASQNRNIHSELLKLAETMLAQAKTQNLDGYKASKSEYVKLTTDYNRNGDLIATLLKQL